MTSVSATKVFEFLFFLLESFVKLVHPLLAPLRDDEPH
jgi:hypothetical protein